MECESNNVQGDADESGNLQPSVVSASVLGTEVYSACAPLQNFIPGPDIRFVYFDSLFSPGWPRTCYVAKDNLELRFLLSLPSNTVIMRMCHYSQP